MPRRSSTPDAPDESRDRTGYVASGRSVARVVLVSPLPPPIGGLSVWTAEFVQAASRHGIDCTLVDTSPGGERVNARSRIRIDRLRQMATTIRELWAALPDRNIAHLTTTWFWSLAREGVYARMCRMRKVVPVLHVHASTQVAQSLATLSPMKRRALGWWLRPFACVVVLSDELRDLFAVALPSQRTSVVPNWVNTDQFRATESRAPRDALTVLFVGRLTAEKGFVNLADAVVANPALQLVTVGDRPDRASGQDRDDVAVALAALDATGRHRNVPSVSRDEIASYYQDADIFALPSWNEGLPLSVLEAMSSGLPCVITGVGAMADLLASSADSPFAIPVGVDDTDALGAAMAELVADPTLRSSLGASGRRIAEARFSSAAAFATLEGLYDELVRPPLVGGEATAVSMPG